MPYSEKQLVKAPMKPSPSLIYNNLTSCAGSLLYAHIRQACTFALSGLAAGVPVAVRKDVIVTAAEDCSIAIWALPIGGRKAELLLSVCWLQAALTGVAFCGPTSDDVAVVAYDTDEVHVYKHVA
ncbi:hypothetical protein TSOC_010512 [Tetrabaena socialis]|uniref:Uncharacterized protein n=1 Tax=Tetrabaena socialis TaxID=47790 RepID=A0A2J7ZT35_9CHLO|nr:hypothetical protein TSOC_010512 [Tetrabaena socialis]|eukprot:PNH03422.1 hypothetical protein TSOC_010512 [Tetrabaena socialis]